MDLSPHLLRKSSSINWLPNWVQASPTSPHHHCLPKATTTQQEDKQNLPHVESLQTLPTQQPHAITPITPLLNASFDLVSPDGCVVSFERLDRRTMVCDVCISAISPQFLGWSVSKESIIFNLKSTLAQLCVDGTMSSLELDHEELEANLKVTLTAETTLGVLCLDYVEIGTRVGKLFVVVDHRRVLNEHYFHRLVGRTDRLGRPLLVYGCEGDWILENIDGRVVAWVKLQPGSISYDFEVTGILPTVGLALTSDKDLHIKNILRLHQKHDREKSRFVQEKQVLMVRSKGMHIRTLFARVVTNLLPKGVRCTNACIVEPHTDDSVEVEKGRTFVFYGTENADVEIERIPLEFFTLEPYREYVRLDTRTSLWGLLKTYGSAAAAFQTSPSDPSIQACVFICKGSQLAELTVDSWVTSIPTREPYEGPNSPDQRLANAQNYMLEQCQYGLLKAIAVGAITSEGVILTKYFISPILKHFLLSDSVCKTVRGICFENVSQASGIFFSQTDRAMLQDLTTFGVQVFQIDTISKKIYEYVHRVGYDCGLFVPVGTGEQYLNATYFGVYGSNLIEGDFEADLVYLFEGIKKIQQEMDHPLLTDRNIAVVTGGGPGVMEVGNRVAKKTDCLSCGLFVDFGAAAKKKGAVINEQKKNPYVDAFMTYRLEKLVERQSDFHLDFPIFCVGGVGTDFEFALENVRRKVGTVAPTPVLLFGPLEYYAEKVTRIWQENIKRGVVKGSEWLSNDYYVVENGTQALEVYKRFFNGTLKAGPDYPGNDRGFVIVDEKFLSDQ